MITAIEDYLDVKNIENNMPFNDLFNECVMPEVQWRWIMDKNSDIYKKSQLPRWAARACLTIVDEWPALIKEQKVTKPDTE